MTEAEWLASRDVMAMYIFLRDSTTLFRTRWQGHRAVPRFAFSARKDRLFAVACCRRVWHLLSDERSRSAVRIAERFADGKATLAELNAALEAAKTAYDDGTAAFYQLRADLTQPHSTAPHAAAIYAARHGPAGEAARSAAYAVFHNRRPFSEAEILAAVIPEFAAQADLLRDIVGNPFRPAAVDPSWLAWNDRCVERMAHGIYQEQAFDRLPILHDALLDAGCDGEAILAHCRTAGGHVRGCWVIDLLRSVD
jgi:hypothetical protein